MAKVNGEATKKSRKKSGTGDNDPVPITIRSEAYAEGRRLRSACPRSSHASWKPSPDRPDPISLLEESSAGRIPELIPVRYARMLESPFAFFRGAALNMAADLASTPNTGLRVQACGDCHLLNFGGFATPERRLVFDINDFDETLPAPWEWDVKRLATSFVLACRNSGFSPSDARDSALACVRSYRESMASFSHQRVLDVWYANAELKKLIPQIEDAALRERTRKQLIQARERSVHDHNDPKLIEIVGRTATIKDKPPLIYHLADGPSAEFADKVQAAFRGYLGSLQDDRRRLLDRFAITDIAVKVVGVGSVGTMCSIVLLLASEKDPLFLQVKEARPSVLEAYVGKSVYQNRGQRVVNGCRLMQSASDLFLGWTEVEGVAHYHVRQLKDMKVKPTVELLPPAIMRQYARLCGWTVARAHARSGEPAKLSGYLGKSEIFDQAIAEFAIAYADQTESDHRVMAEAVKSGRLLIAKEEPEAKVANRESS